MTNLSRNSKGSSEQLNRTDLVSDKNWDESTPENWDTSYPDTWENHKKPPEFSDIGTNVSRGGIATGSNLSRN